MCYSVAMQHTTCSETHDYYPVTCIRDYHELGDHYAQWNGKAIAWPHTTALSLFDSVSARTTDPESSHRAARRDFDIPKGVRGLGRDILDHVGRDWMTCRELVEAIYGPGPYTYDEAVGLNKVQTIALKLYREGYLDRLKPHNGSLLKYRRRTT